MQEESVFGEVFQTSDSKSLSDSAELLSKKLEIMGLNLIEFKKFKMKAQKQILALEQEQDKFVRTEYFRNEHQDYEIRMRNYTANQVGNLQQNVMQNHDLILENHKLYLEELNQCKKDTLWKIKDAEDLLAKRISKHEVINMIETLDSKLTQSHTNLENKILDRLLKAYKEQNAQLETL